MEVFFTLDEIKNIKKPSILSLGTFDGLHKGHMKLLNTLMKKNSNNDYVSIVYTFSNHPRDITLNRSPKLIASNNQKIDLFNEIGIDILIIVEFDDFHRRIKAEDFINDILIGKLNMKSMVVGFDCRFGYNAEGNVDSLKYFSQKYNFDLEIVDPFKINDIVVSSTIIRQFIEEGNIEEANIFLGRKYSLEGIVTKGKQIGKKLGFPTANIKADKNLCIPKPGVYITKTSIENSSYICSITNVGYNPTFDQKEQTIETYLFDYDKDIYNKNIKIQFIKRLRDEMKFSNIDELTAQVKSDIEYAKNYFKNPRCIIEK